MCSKGIGGGNARNGDRRVIDLSRDDGMRDARRVHEAGFRHPLERDGCPSVCPNPFKDTVEERLVLLDGPAKGRPKVVTPEGRDAFSRKHGTFRCAKTVGVIQVQSVEEISGIERAVAQIVVGVTKLTELVCAALAHDRRLTAHRVPCHIRRETSS